MVAPFRLVAQLDRASDFESEGCRFESCRGGQRQPCVLPTGAGAKIESSAILQVLEHKAPYKAPRPRGTSLKLGLSVGLMFAACVAAHAAHAAQEIVRPRTMSTVVEWTSALSELQIPSATSRSAPSRMHHPAK